MAKLLNLATGAVLSLAACSASAGQVVVNDKMVIVDFTKTMGPEAVLGIELIKTTRVPEDGKEYGLPPNLGAIEALLARDANKRFAKPEWLARDTILAPVEHTQAMWINFTNPQRLGGYHGANASYPFAMIIATGKLNAISGEPLGDLNLKAEVFPPSHNYIVTGGLGLKGHQRWIDGYKVGPKSVRQFVAVSRGSGTSVEEYLTGKTEFGGVQIVVYPLKPSVWVRVKGQYESSGSARSARSAPAGEKDIAAGGLIRQNLEFPAFLPADFDQTAGVKFWLTMVDHEAWPYLTGKVAAPATVTPPAKEKSPFADAPKVGPPNGSVSQGKKW